MRTLSEQALAVARREVSPVDLVERSLSEIERTQPLLNAFTRVFANEARLRARELQSLAPVGPLHGIPVAVKELFDVTGVPTSGACNAFEDNIADGDSAIVGLLRDAGAILVGKTNQHELAMGPTNQVSSFGPVRNPWDLNRMSGGSSGGSGAAVSARIVMLAIGSDTAGSVRVPAACCGVTALKPTRGAISVRGMMPLDASMDTAGPMAISAADCWLAFDVVQGFDVADPWSERGAAEPRSRDGTRIALATNFFDLADPEVRSAVEGAVQTFEAMGVEVIRIDGPDPNETWKCSSRMFGSSIAHNYKDLVEDERVSAYIRRLIFAGLDISGADVMRATARARVLRRSFERVLIEVDAILTPTIPFPAQPIDADSVEIDGRKFEMQYIARLTGAANVTGLPAIAFPVGFSSDGLPLSAQLTGGAWSEERLCSIAALYQEATDWHLRAPNGI